MPIISDCFTQNPHCLPSLLPTKWKLPYQEFNATTFLLKPLKQYIVHKTGGVIKGLFIESPKLWDMIDVRYK